MEPYSDPAEDVVFHDTVNDGLAQEPSGIHCLLSSTDARTDSTGPFFSVGMPVVLTGLTERKDLNGGHGTGIAPHSSEGRVAVKLYSGEKVRIKSCNITPSTFNQYPW